MFIRLGQTKDKGRGIFAAQNLYAHSLIEIAPVIVLPKSQEKFLAITELNNYYFAWGDNGSIAIGLGYISLYNHSYDPNAYYVKDLVHNSIAIYPLKVICTDEEITVNYNSEPGDQSPVWFDYV